MGDAQMKILDAAGMLMRATGQVEKAEAFESIKCRIAALTAERDALRAKFEEARGAIQAAIDCGMVPTTSASEGGASRYAEQVIVADRLRQVIAKATGGDDGQQ